MKKHVSRIILLIFSCAVLFFWHGYQNYVPDFEDMAAFDPSGYGSRCTYAMQAFVLKPHDRNWFLSSVAHYDETGKLEYETVYELDETGQAYYINGDRRIDVTQTPRAGFSGLADFFEGQNIMEEHSDEFCRMISRSWSNLDPARTRTETIWLYYATDSNGRSDDDAISTYVLTHHYKYSEAEEPVMYVGPEEQPCWEATSYCIANLDKYGNETSIFLGDANCYMKTDTDGYLQMIILDNIGSYIVYRVDASGRPLWSATYSKADNTLMGYTVWNYTAL